MNRKLLPVVLLTVSLGCVHHAPTAQGAAPANPPPEQPTQAQGDVEIEKLLAAIEPYVQKARATYPGVRDRFLAGLPEGSALFVTVQLRDLSGNMEQAFVQVASIRDGRIGGVILNDINTVIDYRKGEQYSFPESELIDWTIVNADGSEEGNVVGTFLDGWEQTDH